MKLEINFKKKNGKFTNMWILNNILLNNQWVKETERKIKTYPETNENGNSIYQNLQAAAKAILRQKLIGINAYIKKKKRFQVNSLTLNFEEIRIKEVSVYG